MLKRIFFVIIVGLFSHLYLGGMEERADGTISRQFLASLDSLGFLFGEDEQAMRRLAEVMGLTNTAQNSHGEGASKAESERFKLKFAPSLKASLIAYLIKFPKSVQEEILTEDLKKLLSKVRFLLSNFNDPAVWEINRNHLLIEITLLIADNRGNQREILEKLITRAADRHETSALAFFVELGVSSAIICRQIVLEAILQGFSIAEPPISALAIAKFLVQLGADVNLFLRIAQRELANLPSWRSDLHRAEIQEVIKFLQSKILPDDNNRARETELLVASSVGNNEAIIRLLTGDVPVSIETRDSEGNTALMLSARTGYTETVKLLLLYGADVTAKNRIEEDAATLAEQTGQHTLAKLLRSEQDLHRRPNRREWQPAIIAYPDPYNLFYRDVLRRRGHRIEPDPIQGVDRATLGTLRELRNVGERSLLYTTPMGRGRVTLQRLRQSHTEPATSIPNIPFTRESGMSFVDTEPYFLTGNIGTQEEIETRLGDRLELSPEDKQAALHGIVTSYARSIAALFKTSKAASHV